MAINLGETRRLSALFTKNGAAFDPTTVTLQLKPPSGSVAAVGPGGLIIHPGTGSYYYDYVSTEIGNTIATWIGIAASSEVTILTDVVEVAAALLMPRVMTSNELDQCVGPAKVDQLFDDRAAGFRDPVLVSQALRRGEDYAMSSLLNAWDEAGATAVLQNDSLLRMHVAWIVLELAAERRGEFLGVDGKGPYWSQMQRADKYLDSIGRGRTGSVAESRGAGQNGQTGGSVSPRIDPPVSRFVFAPDRRNPTGHGGYLLLVLMGFELVLRAMMHHG